jgi:hypothetical protein
LTNKYENALFVNPGQPISKSDSGLRMPNFDVREGIFIRPHQTRIFDRWAYPDLFFRGGFLVGIGGFWWVETITNL